MHPLIREFYEHTSRFRLSIIPEWRQWMKPGYVIFKRLVAEPLGQAAIPALATNDRVPANLLGSTQALVMGSPADFALNAGAWQWQTRRSGMPSGARGVNETLARLWKGNTGLEYSGARADAALAVSHPDEEASGMRTRAYRKSPGCRPTSPRWRARYGPREPRLHHILMIV